MSEIAAAAHVQATLCDFALSDAAGKVNIIGAGVAGLGYEPTSGTTTRFSLVVDISVPGEMCPLDFALEIALLDASGDIADVPGPAGPQKMRIGHMVRMEKPVPPLG
ncbi:MAG: hypothetical protein HGA44_18140, partial [Cellulomonadaceae bacterium]|nr:hypothetical protein [Cellulomonadaceae bacterium]